MMISCTCRSISEAHSRLMQHLIWNHQDLMTEDGEQTWEGIPTGVTITSPLKDMINPASSFQKARCEEYAKQIISGVNQQTDLPTQFSYTYHERLYCNSQFEDVINRLMESKDTRRAVMYTWFPPVDSTKSEVPCLQFVQYLVRDDQLHCNVIFRSEDILSAFGPNAYGLVRLQEYVANTLGYPVGTYHHIVTVPHLYPIRDKSDLERWL